MIRCRRKPAQNISSTEIDVKYNILVGRFVMAPPCYISTKPKLSSGIYFQNIQDFCEHKIYSLRWPSTKKGSNVWIHRSCEMDYLSPGCAAKSLGTANNLLNTFVTTIIALHCNLTSSDNWPPDYGRTALKHGLADYDFVVIGAGTAGSVVAGRLAENPHNNVLLIEAGSDPPSESEISGLYRNILVSDIDWQYPFECGHTGQGYEPEVCTWHNGRVVGGTHSTNGMLYVRGNARDYDDWERAGNHGWGWEDVQYYFKKTENFIPEDIYGKHGRGGPLNIEAFAVPATYQDDIIKMGTDIGYKRIRDFDTGYALGFGEIFGTLENGRRMTTAKAFLRRLRPNLHLIKNAVAKRILFDHDRRAGVVKFVYKDRYPMKVRAKKEIIVSAGAIESPKLLMLSGIGPKVHLEALGIPVVRDLPVACHIEDHVRGQLYFKIRNKSNYTDATVKFLDAFYQQWVHRDGPYGTPSALLNINGFVSTKGSDSYHDIQYLFQAIETPDEAAAGLREYIQSRLLDSISPSDQLFVASIVLTRPKSKGYMRLRSTDYHDKPFIQPNYYDHPDDLNTVIRGIEKLLEFKHSSTFNDLNGRFIRLNLPECDVHVYRSKKYWKCYLKFMSLSTFNVASSVRMGPKISKRTVVDSELQVHGVKRLRVIDASVMPNVISANAVAATVMIAEKGADMIRSKWEV